ncbi:MAG: molybdopterin molybdotransferase MoeA [Gammaproteobacteria bacterium]|nr:molybdopterin molybdotransferase MoeA [Gammaproteobacteria bacterium]
MTTVAEAEALIAARIERWPAARVALADATGRVLAETVRAERDLPPFDRVTMDGIAIASSAFAEGRRQFRIAAIQAAGEPAASLVSPDACIRIMTGAVRPEHADAVIPIERVQIDGDVASVDDAAVVSPGRFIHAQGGDRKAGDVVLEPGTVVGPAEAAVLASAGCADVAVAYKPSVAVVSTGDELVGVDQRELAPHQIRSSNDYAVAASLTRAGVGECHRAMLPDDPDTILASVRELHDRHDVMILSGGVSMGEFDFVPAALETLGAELVFHRIAQKPGRPMWFGISAAGKPIFALPGNPVSTLLCMTRYVVPALRAAAGLNAPAPEFARLTADVDGPADMTYFVPVVLSWDNAQAVELAEPRPTNTSGDFSTLAATDGFIELASGETRHPAGTIGRIHRW